MAKWELTFSITTKFETDLDLDEVSKILKGYDNTDLNQVEFEVVEPYLAFVTFSIEADYDDNEFPTVLELFNDEDEEDHDYVTELVNYTRVDD